jgi:hypothetical protein
MTVKSCDSFIYCMNISHEASGRGKGEKTLSNQDKRSLSLEEKIEEHKTFLRDFQRLIGPEWLEKLGGLATIDRQLIMIDALVTTAQAELQQNYNAKTLARYLYAVFVTVRDNRLTTDPRILAIEAEYQRRGGTRLNNKHSVLLFTTGSFYEHMSGRELSTACR